MIQPSLLTAAEIRWIDDYHARVWERVSPRMDVGSAGHAWLRQATLPLAEQGLSELPPGRKAGAAQQAVGA